MRFKRLITAIFISFLIASNANAVPFRKIVLEDMSIGSGPYTSPSGKVTGKTKINTSGFPFSNPSWNTKNPNDWVDRGFDTPIYPSTIISGGPEISIQKYDADGNGAISNAELATAISTIGAVETTLVIDAEVTVSATHVFPDTLAIRFVRPGKFTKSGGGAIAINGPMSAPLYQLFDSFSVGNVTFGVGIGTAIPEWWGADPTGTSDSLSALTLAMSAAPSTGIDIICIGSFKVSNSLVTTKDKVRFIGIGKASKIFTEEKYTVIEIETDDVTLENLWIYHSGSSDAGEGGGPIKIGNVNHVERAKVLNCVIENGWFAGAFLIDASNCLLEANEVLNNGAHGFASEAIVDGVDENDSNRYVNNYIHDNGGIGMYLDNRSNYAQALNNSLKYNGATWTAGFGGGIRVVNSFGVRIQDNTIISSYARALDIVDSTFGIFSGNIIVDADIGGIRDSTSSAIRISKANAVVNAEENLVALNSIRTTTPASYHIRGILVDASAAKNIVANNMITDNHETLISGNATSLLDTRKDQPAGLFWNGTQKSTTNASYEVLDTVLSNSLEEFMIPERIELLYNSVGSGSEVRVKYRYIFEDDTSVDRAELTDGTGALIKQTDTWEDQAFVDAIKTDKKRIKKIQLLAYRSVDDGDTCTAEINVFGWVVK